MKVEFHGLDGYGGPLYVGTGCFHRRDTLCGRKFNKQLGYKHCDWNSNTAIFDTKRSSEESIYELEENLKSLASCTYDQNTQWGIDVSDLFSLSISLSQVHTHVQTHDMNIY